MNLVILANLANLVFFKNDKLTMLVNLLILVTLLFFCESGDSQESSEYSISGNYDKSGDFKKNLIIVGDPLIL